MATEIVMPQMGESITEGTITKWLKQVGDRVERDEMIFEISTDKVDAEIPSPTSGVLLQILHNEGETLEVGKAVAIVGEAGESGASAASAAGASNGNSANANAAPTQTTQPASTQTAALEAEQESAEALDAQIPGAGAPSSNAPNQTTSAPAQPQVQTAASSNPPSAGSTAAPSGNATEVVMPQMGESITEGTITKWLKKTGDRVERDEMIFEISTDKVDAEIPSPTAGILLEIRGQEGETIEVGKVVALIGETGASGAAPAANSTNGAAQTAQAVQGPEQKTAQSTTAQQIQIPQTSEVKAPTPNEWETANAGHPEQVETEGRSYDYARTDAVEEAAESANGAARTNGADITSLEELRRTRSSPLVRKIAEEHKIDIARIAGTGTSGRVTKEDIMNFIASGAALTPQQAVATAKTGAALPKLPPTSVQPPAQPQQFTAPQPVQAPVAPTTTAATGDRVEPMSVMRKKIAQHMVMSKQTSAHVSSVYEIDMTSVVKFRDKNKDAFQARYNTKLTFMPFIFQAVTSALRKFPIVNSQVSGENIIYKGDVNLGMAVALDWGLIVPVVKRADTLSLAGLALTANDLADRARSKKLSPDEVQGGTFTITNPGVFGGLFGTPIINQPQVAILCVGTIEKRPKVITSADGDDFIAIRQMAYFALTYDHRVVDGADAEKFLSYIKETLESGQFSL